MRARSWITCGVSALALVVSLVPGLLLGMAGDPGAGFALGWRHDRGRNWAVVGVHLFQGDERDRDRHGRTDEAWYFKNANVFGGIRGPLHEHRYRRLLGFTLMVDRPNAPEWYVVVGAPFWLVILVSSLGFWRSTRRLWPPRPPAGRCGRCGYDLRATPERCPECGTNAALPLENQKELDRA